MKLLHWGLQAILRQRRRGLRIRSLHCVVSCGCCVHPAGPAVLSAAMNLQQLSTAAIDQALQAARGNLSEAARPLGISRQTLYRKLAARKPR